MTHPLPQNRNENPLYPLGWLLEPARTLRASKITAAPEPLSQSSRSAAVDVTPMESKSGFTMTRSGVNTSMLVMILSWAGEIGELQGGDYRVGRRDGFDLIKERGSGLGTVARAVVQIDWRCKGKRRYLSNAVLHVKLQYSDRGKNTQLFRFSCQLLASAKFDLFMIVLAFVW